MKNKDKNKSYRNSEKKQNTKTSRVYQTLSAFTSYLGCIGISLVVMYFLNGTVGILLAMALGCAFFISVAATLIVMYSVKMDFKLDKPSVSKGDTLKCVVTMSKKIVIPAPMIELHISCTPHLSKETDICRISLAGNEINEVEIPLKAKYSGAAEVKFDEVLIIDYLGIFRFRLKNAYEKSVMKLSVYPNIPDVPVQTDFLKTAVLVASDDEEEETDETAIGQTGQPGYDHREYYPGDPIKRINWKMSSKRDIYMIRLDEKVAESGQMFFLDSPQLTENDYTLSIRDNIIEGMLAVFNMLVREGRETTFFFAEKDMWHKIDIHTTADIYTLQEMLAGFKPCTAKKAVPPEIISSGKTPICFTTATADNPNSAAQIASENPEVLMICTLSSGLPRFTSEMWVISEDFELKKQL